MRRLFPCFPICVSEFLQRLTHSRHRALPPSSLSRLIYVSSPLRRSPFTRRPFWFLPLFALLRLKPWLWIYTVDEGQLPRNAVKLNDSSHAKGSSSHEWNVAGIAATSTNPPHFIHLAFVVKGWTLL